MRLQDNSTQAAWEEGVDLMHIFHVWWTHIWLLVLAALLGGAVVFGAAKLFIAPSYQAGFAAYINNKSGASDEIVSSSDVSASQSMANTYAEMITRRFLLEEAAERIEKEYSYEEMERFVSASTIASMEIVEVTVVMEDPSAAVELAQAIAEVAELRIEKIVEGSSMQIFELPVMPAEICAPDYLQLAAMGAVLSLIFAATILALRELFDDRVLTKDGPEARLGIPMLGCVPDLEAAKETSDGYRWFQPAKPRYRISQKGE